MEQVTYDIEILTLKTAIGNKFINKNIPSSLTDYKISIMKSLFLTALNDRLKINKTTVKKWLEWRL